MYAIHATISHKTDSGYTGSRQIPTFYLDERVQGIVDEDHAARIASDIINPLGLEVTVHATAVDLGKTDTHPSSAAPVDPPEPGPADTEVIVFHWSRHHGDCYDCGRPAAFTSVQVDGPKHCAVCAANAAAAGEEIMRIEELT